MSLGPRGSVHHDSKPLWTKGLGCVVAGCIPHDPYLGSSREVGLTFVWSLVVQSYWNHKSIEFHLAVDIVTKQATFELGVVWVATIHGQV